MKTKTLALILSVVMVLSVVFFTVSCSSGSDVTTTASEKAETTETTSKTDVTTEADTEAVTTEEQTTEEETTVLTGYEKLPGFEDVDFGGTTFLIASHLESDADWSNAADFWVEDITNDAVNDAVFDRNRVIQNLYNCKIEVDDGGWENGYNASVASGDGKYIAGSANSRSVVSLSKTGNYYNLLKLDVDWTQSWWDQNYIMDTSTDGKLYAIIGDFALHAMSATWIMFYNKDVYETKFSETDIYQLVREKKWTIDVMADMISRIKNDANGDSAYTFSEGADADTVGMMTTSHNDRGLYFASGLRYVIKTENTVNGSFTTALLSQDTAPDVIAKLIDVCNMEGYISGGYTNVQTAVQNGTTLFAGEVLDVLRRMAGSENLRVGVLPQPLLNASQENYHCYVNDKATVLMIPTSYSDMAVIADFLTLFSYHSQMIVRKAYINTYKYTYASDEDSAEMVDIILNSRIYDVGYIDGFSISMDGYISTMISSQKNQYAKAAENFAKKDSANIEEYRSAIEAIDDNY
ncbi:MAG: hypothetical protein K6F14_09270 [Clostridiales bacterium]|nr:hypothetical protein [Clostridiales bacterium]